MRIAIMQPYVFPYIGYFQLINSVDKFVFYDDVNFIKQGWINRNKVLVSGKDFMFTVPLLKATSFSYIKDTKINNTLYESWKMKFLQTISQSYKKAPHFEEVYNLLSVIFNAKYNTISELAIASVEIISNFLNTKTEFINSSKSYPNTGLHRTDRLIDICKQENGNHYINALGGKELYTKEDFLVNGIHLQFLKSLPINYKQFKDEFVSSLSIIDVMMFNSKEEIKVMLDQYELL